MKNQPNPNGFAAPTLKGRELTQSQFDNLPDVEKNVVVHRINGPHHDAKWARALRERDTLVMPLVWKQNGHLMVNC